MSLIEVSLNRRPKSSSSYQPQFEVLEARECPAVASPGNLQLAALSPTQVKLTWNDVANETGYNIYRMNGSQQVLVAQVGRNVTSYTVGNLAANSTQSFQIEAFDLSTKARSVWASITTPREAIAAPASVKLTDITQTQMTVNWSLVNNATGYRIYGWDGTKEVLLGQVGKGVASFRVQNLAPGTNHYFYVEAFHATNSKSTDWVSGATLAAGLTAPTNVQAQVVNNTTIALSWKDVSGESGYRVYRYDGNQTVLIGTLAANATGFQATGLAPGKKYSFYVQAFTPTATANSAWVEATTSGTPLASITNLTAVATGPSTVRLNWTEPAGAAGYRIYVWSSAGWVPVMTVAKGTSQVTVGNLFSNRTQWFLVEAFNANFTEVSSSNRVQVYL